MLAISDAVKEAWLNPARQLSIRVKVDKTMYGSEDVSSLSFDSGSISGEVYQIGSTYMNSVTLSFPSIIETIKEDLEVIPELGILVDGEYHFFKLGHFYITEFNRDRNANITTITANDKMIYLEGAYDSKLTYPKPYREVALEIANLAGVEVNQASFASLGIGAIKKPEGYTYRQAIGLIAQFEGGFASFNRDGELEIRRLRPTEFGVTPESYLLKGFTKNENSYKIGGITVRIGEEETDVLKIGNTTGPQIELENKVMTQTLLNQMWELVKTLNYFPFELKWRGCPALEAGDWIYVTDRNGNRYSVPNLSYSMNFNGGLSAESKATTNSVSQSATKYRGSLNQKVQWLESILGSNDWNHNYYDEKPDNPKVGDLWFKKTGKDIEIWQYVEIDGVRDWELQISSAPNQDLLDMIEDLVGATADAQAAADEAKTVGEEAAQLANEAKTESAKALEDANAAINSVSYLGQIVQAVDKASQLAIEQSANAVADAQAAMVKANELLTSVNEIEGTITNITADIDAINGELAVKVDQTTFNQLKGTVDTHTTSISANAQAIKLKANQSTVDTISGKVNANSAELSVQADKISGLVTKTDGQSTQIANLELQAGQFNLTLSSVQSDIDGINSNDNLIDKTFTFTNNKDISITTGLEDTGKRTIINEFIPVVPNNTYVFYKPEKSGNVGFRAYTAEKAYIGAPGKSNETDRSAMFKTPANCYFIRFIDESNKLTKGYRLQVASATVTALTSVQATVDGLVTTVATKANQSQVTQLANQITSVVTEVNKKAYDYKYRTRNSGSTDNNKWYKILTSTLTAQYQDTRTGLTLIGSSSRDSITRSADIFINVKQQAVMGSAPAVEIGVIGCSQLVPEDFAAVLTENSSSKTIVEVYLKNRATYTIYNIEPYNVVTPSRQEFVDSAVPIVSLPTGTQWVGKKRGAMEGLETVSSQITQLSDQINLRVTKDDVVNQINISPSGVLIAANKIQITGLTKIDNAVIATAHIKDLAITNAKIANLAVNTAKIGDAAIVTAKIGDLAVTNAKIANLAINDAKIQNASISSAKIISLDANKIVANTLSAITTNTGTLNVSGWLSITSDNKGLSGTYDFGDQYGGAVNARWFDGNWRLSHRHLLFSGSIYEVNSNNTKGKFLYDGETFLGADYFKLRQYNSGMTVLKNRVDITAAQISMGDLSNYNSKVLINSNGTLWLDDSMTVGGVYIKDLKPLNVYHIEAVESANNLYFNNDRTDLADFRIGKDGSTVNGGRLISSMAIYNRTYGAIAQVGITASGALGRITSARKYKRDILIADKVIANSKKVLSITPVSWKDKVEVLDGNAVNRYYGFIADDFHEAGLTEVVIYGENGEIESLAYDRITMYHNVILSEHEKEINLLKKKVEILENEIRVLQVA